MRLLVILSLLALSGCSLHHSRVEGRALSGAEINRLFQGHSFTLVGMKSGNELVAFAEGEYCAMRYVDGEWIKRVRWFVQGDRHCCIKKGRTVCGDIYEVDDGVYHKVSDEIHSHTMKNFSAGNQL